jgi:hypothetical protein
MGVVVVSSGGGEGGDDDDERSTFLLLLLLVLSCTAGDLFAPALNTKSSSQFSDGTKVYHSVLYNHHTKKGTRITSTVIMNGIHKLNGRGGMSRVGREKEGWVGTQARPVSLSGPNYADYVTHVTTLIGVPCEHVRVWC